MQTAEAPAATSTTIKHSVSPWTARVGLAVVGIILVSCFGLLIASSHAATIAQ